MSVAIGSAFLFILISLVLRYGYYKFPIDKIKASWMSFLFAAIATTICAMILGTEQQHTLISGFATMLICYNILCYNPFDKKQ